MQTRQQRSSGSGVQYLCLGVVMVISCVMSATYYVLALSLPLYSRIPLWGAISVSVGVAALAIALDLLKPSMVFLAAESWRERMRMRSLAALFLALVLTAVSMWAIDGLLLMFRGWSVEGPAQQISTWEKRERAYLDDIERLRTLPAGRPAHLIEVDMSRIRIDPSILRRTNYCDPAETTKPESREACAPLQALKAEMVALNERKRLESRLGEHRSWLETNQKPADPDPQVKVVAKLLGADIDLVSVLRWSVLGLVIELVLWMVPYQLASRRPRPRLSADPTLQGLSLPAGSEDQAKRRLATLMQENGNRILAPTAKLATLLETSVANSSKWRRRWIDEGLIKQSWVGSSLLIEPGPNWFAAPKAISLVAH